MTPEILEYLLRATVIWLALLAYYFVAGHKASFRFQRFFLLGGWLFGLAVPLLPSMAGEAGLPVANLPTISFTGPAVAGPAVEVRVDNGWTMADYLPWLYLLGVLVFAARTLVQGWVTEQYVRTGQRSTFNGYPVIRSQRITAPFAARGFVFLPQAMTDAELTHTALIHETSHLRARHHYDKFLLTLGSIVLWFHPLTWAYRSLLATVHEYEADAAVLQRVPARTYGLQLLHCSLGPAGKLGLFSSPLKKRIEMITDKNRERKLRFVPLLGLCLLLLGLVVACSDITSDLTLASAEEIPVIGLALTDEIDEYPRLKSTINNGKTAEQSFVETVYGNIKYPEAAIELSQIGRVDVELLINRKGKVLDYTIVPGRIAGNNEKDFSNALSIIAPDTKKDITENTKSTTFTTEVERVIQSLGDFQPAEKNGEAVVVRMKLKFMFYYDTK